MHTTQYSENDLYSESSSGVTEQTRSSVKTKNYVKKRTMEENKKELEKQEPDFSLVFSFDTFKNLVIEMAKL
jgi:hypothetical protein